MSNLLSVQELRDLLGDPRLSVIDARYDLNDPQAGREAWLTSHIPGSVHLDLSRDLSGPAGKHGGRHPLPEPDSLARTFGAAGIGPDSQVVVYDHDTGMFAARVWWMLRYMGFDAVQVLDGGFRAWQEAGAPLSREGRTPDAAAFVPDVRLELLASRDEVMAALGNDAVRLLDARTPERYRGEVAAFDPVVGHIPGAVNRPYTDNVRGGRMLPRSELRELHADSAGLPEVIAYCGSGVSAALAVLAMTEAGLPMPRLYAGSWSDWITFEDAPTATG